jgi:hypothetical protein
MAEASESQNSSRAAITRPLICGMALLVMTLLLQGRAGAQSATGPLPGAAPSDQPSQAPPRAAMQNAEMPNLAGTWKLNPDQSDNPMEKMREAQQESDGPGVGGGGRRGMGGGGALGGNDANGGGSGGGNEGQNGAAQQNGENQQRGQRRGGMQQMAQLVIEQTPTSTKVTDASGRVMALYLAPSDQGNAQSNTSNSDANTPPAAQWQDHKLVATQQMRNGGTTMRTYELSTDRKQLVVTTKIENKRFKVPLTIRQVYDPVYASTGGD